MHEPVNCYKKTRIAPTPSGFLHLGNILSFISTVALARRHGAKILLRIDDLDRTRANRLYIQDIFDTLNFLDIPWDEGPVNAKDFEDNYSQLHRVDIYQEALKQLADKKLVFACTCSRRQIQTGVDCNCYNKHISLTTNNSSWRFITTRNVELTVKNFNGQTVIGALPDEMHNFVVKRKDGFPAYQLTSVVDDLYFGVDMVVRGEDLWTSTLAQHELALALKKNSFQNIAFYHHPLLREETGKKLSKSAGSTSVKYLRESGLKPAEIYKLIASMLGINRNIANWEQLAETLTGNL